MSAKEDTSPDAWGQNMSADTTRDSAAADTVNNQIIVSMDSASDTMTLARLDREHQGPCEAEYFYGEEADLHQHYHSCVKNPGHKNFIPVDKFSIQDLPEDYRDNDVVDYIRAVSDLTVRVTVKYVSDKRPDTEAGNGHPYPGYSGRQRTTVGTGCVSEVNMSPINPGHRCKCTECRNSCTPSQNYAYFCIRTAAHVVFDDSEGEHTTCLLFFDRGNTPETCSSVVTLTGMTDVASFVKDDTCVMSHYTHDLELAHRIDKTLKEMQRLREAIRTKMPQICAFKRGLDVIDRQPLLFIVSHPHGCSKQISLGRWIMAHMFYNKIASFMYSTATCPGSSGALVCMMQERTELDFCIALSPLHRVHRGVFKVPYEINYCTNFEVVQETHLVTMEMLQPNKAPWEHYACARQEEGLVECLTACKKNPGHKNCFPLAEFSMDHLPSFYRSDDVMKFIKLVSDLTVRMSVSYVSEKRPETVPGTDIPYPWYGNRGSNQIRVGNGLIVAAGVALSDVCRCRECKDSVKPYSRHSYITIKTSAHLVYDQLEAEHTTCHMLFDPIETSEAYKNVFTLANVNSLYGDTVNETSTLEYHTHNFRFEHLAIDLFKMVYGYSNVLYLLIKNGDVDFTKYVNQYGKQEAPLEIMISHPHGGCKHITIGYRRNPDDADTERSQSPYSFVACPGSIGAPVIMLGWEFVHPICK